MSLTENSDPYIGAQMRDFIMYTFITNEKIVVSNLVEVNDDTIVIHSVKAGHDLLITGETKKSIKYLYSIICNDITSGKSVINLIDIKEHYCMVEINGI